MVEFFFSIGVLVVLGLFIFLFVEYVKSKDEYNKHLKELFGKHVIIGDDFVYEQHHSIKDIKKYFKENPDILKQREEEWRKEKGEERKNNEKKRKERIKDRIWAYDYEETLFEIYAPLAEFKYGTWQCGFEKKLSKDELIQKISAHRHISTHEASKLFEEFVAHNVINEYNGDYYFSMLYDWDVVSDLDMNMEKWIDAHGKDMNEVDSTEETIVDSEGKNRCSKVENIINPQVVNTWSLLDFAKAHGKMQVGDFVNKETGEEFKSCIFTRHDGTRTFVVFSTKLGELTPKQIVDMKNELQVVQLESGNYSLCKKAW